MPSPIWSPPVRRFVNSPTERRFGEGMGAIRTAHVLNSGIRDVGSSAGLVRRFGRPSPAQWNGMNTVS